MSFQHEVQRKTCTAIYNQSKPKGQPVLCRVHVLPSIPTCKRNVPKTLEAQPQRWLEEGEEKWSFKYILMKASKTKNIRKFHVFLTGRNHYFEVLQLLPLKYIWFIREWQKICSISIGTQCIIIFQKIVIWKKNEFYTCLFMSKGNIMYNICSCKPYLSKPHNIKTNL